MRNDCIFSADRRYRYTLHHRWAELFEERCVMWIGLNPSTADEQALDPTLRRIRAFSTAWGYTAFAMTNLFAFRATDPRVMMMESDPVGPENDRVLVETARRCDLVVAAWGVHGDHLARAEAVCRLLEGVTLVCLGITQAGSPKHPLYVRAAATLHDYKIGADFHRRNNSLQTVANRSKR
jgi:hypothetical protein